MKENISYGDFSNGVECYKLQLIGLCCLIVMILTIIFNGILILMFLLYKDLQTPLNTLVITLCVLHFFGAFLEFPFIIVSNFKCR